MIGASARLWLGLAAAALSFSLVAPAAAPADGRRLIVGDRSAGGLVIARTTPAEAIGRLGAPSLRRSDPPYSCVLAWKAIGLRLEFVDLDRGAPCKAGALIVVTITNRPLWHTSRGLQVGDTAGRAHALFPAAALKRGLGSLDGYWLITRHACKEVGGSAFPGLLARLDRGRVRALVLSASVCE